MFNDADDSVFQDSFDRSPRRHGSSSGPVCSTPRPGGSRASPRSSNFSTPRRSRASPGPSRFSTPRRSRGSPGAGRFSTPRRRLSSGSPRYSTPPRRQSSGSPRLSTPRRRLSSGSPRYASPSPVRHRAAPGAPARSAMFRGPSARNAGLPIRPMRGLPFQDVAPGYQSPSPVRNRVMPGAPARANVFRGPAARNAAFGPARALSLQEYDPDIVPMSPDLGWYSMGSRGSMGSLGSESDASIEWQPYLDSGVFDLSGGGQNMSNF
ncbi:uncharacterized protein [Ambystoma mexicanum]|uniref:uncharacterized protein isoform X3 n=1 Tax=Ambystoma mexicanum TaxID=8296 RepID=UPI0037E93E32